MRISTSSPTAGGVNGSKPPFPVTEPDQRRGFQRHVEPKRRLGRASVGGQETIVTVIPDNFTSSPTEKPRRSLRKTWSRGNLR